MTCGTNLTVTLPKVPASRWTFSDGNSKLKLLFPSITIAESGRFATSSRCVLSACDRLRTEMLCTEMLCYAFRLRNQASKWHYSERNAHGAISKQACLLIRD